VSTPPRSIDAGVALGEIFVDKYRVDAILGHGGMGVVALCTHLALDERVAIKMLRKDVLDDADAVERFMREAQAASKLKSEYVARVTDVGRSASNVPYMVMEYLEGHDLGQLLEDRGSIGMPWAIELTLQACEALAEAHSIGIVHRDIKPTNLFVTWRPDGSALVKVLDFGISKALTASGLQLTQTQSLLGTPAYMSPEQMRSARLVDPRTDIWALGTVLYELLEGRRPFEAESFSEICVRVAVEPPAAMTKAPPALQRVVLRCLAKTPEYRYASMAELAADLVPFSHDPHQAQVLAERMARTLRRSQVIDWDAAASGRGFGARELRSAERRAIAAAASDPTPPAHAVGQPAAALEETSNTLSVPRHRHRTLVIAGAIALAAMLGAVVSLTRDPAPPSADPPRSTTTAPQKPIADTPPAPRVVTNPTLTPAAQGSGAAPVLGPRDRPAASDASLPKGPRPAVAPKTDASGKPRAVAPAADASKRDTRPPPERWPPACDVFGDPHAAACPKRETRPGQN
jgi:eukaryotic-like serine/threonine-protein kinase